MNEEQEDLLIVLLLAGVLTAIISTCLLVTEREIAAFVGAFLP